MCLENSEIHLTHDTLKPDGPFDGHAPGRALTQVSQQVRAEFLLVYKRTTIFHVHVEDLEEYIKTWLNGPASEGKIYISFSKCYRDREQYRRAPGSLERSLGDVTVDIIPLVKLRRAEPKFQFWICNLAWDEGMGDVIPEEQSEYIDDMVQRVELRLRQWHVYFTLYLKPGYRHEDCERYTVYRKELRDWVGDVWMGPAPDFGVEVTMGSWN
jgi:hypothetical protein